MKLKTFAEIVMCNYAHTVFSDIVGTSAEWDAKSLILWHKTKPALVVADLGRFTFSFTLSEGTKMNSFVVEVSEFSSNPASTDTADRILHSVSSIPKGVSFKSVYIRSEYGQYREYDENLELISEGYRWTNLYTLRFNRSFVRRNADGDCV